LVDERSPEQLADAIRALASDPDLMTAQGERNRQIVREAFSLGNVDRFGDWLSEIEKDKN
jgi:glycosyltransferase involved in cell wall biosynthesis